MNEPGFAARMSVFVIFALNGAAAGTWAPRVPAVAERVRADAGALGLALLGASVGMIAAALLTGRLAARYGARLLVLVSALATAAVLPLLAVVTSTIHLGVVLAGVGASMGMLDVAMNIAAVTVVRVTGRPLMPIFHAGFSFGALAGSAGAAVAAGTSISLLGHFGVVAVLTVGVAVAVIRYVPREQRAEAASVADRSASRPAVRRPVLWLLGTIALCSAMVEGASADWSALFAVRERGLSEAAAAITFSVFSVSMAVTRLLGERAERRWGADRLLVVGALTASAGLVLAVLVPVAATSYVGFALAGAGLAFSFPVALGLAGSIGGVPGDPRGAGGERAIGFVTAIAYSGLLIGPPLIGGIAQLTNLEVAIGFAGVVAALIAPVTVAATAARRREQRRHGRSAREQTQAEAHGSAVN